MGTLVFYVLLILLWQGGYWLSVDVLQIFKSYSVPSPMGVAQCFVDLCRDGSLPEATLNSLLRGLAGFLIAVVIGVVVGLLIHGVPYFKKHLKPLILGHFRD